MKFIVGLVYEYSKPSLTRVIAITAWVAFLLASGYLLLKNQTWGHYETFATMTAGGGAITQICNKLVNSKYNSPAGQPTEQGGAPQC